MHLTCVPHTIVSHMCLTYTKDEDNVTGTSWRRCYMTLRTDILYNGRIWDIQKKPFGCWADVVGTSLYDVVGNPYISSNVSTKISYKCGMAGELLTEQCISNCQTYVRSERNIADYPWCDITMCNHRLWCLVIVITIPTPWILLLSHTDSMTCQKQLLT